MQDLFPQQAKFRRKVESKLLAEFEDHGFEMVSCGAFEYVDTLLRGRAAAEAEAWVRVFDTLGRTVALRPEMTPSIARMAAPLLSSSNREIRWCYAERVYHRTDDPASLSWVSGRAAESTQVGVEWIGPSGSEIDARLLLMCQSGLSRLGLKDWQMVVSHAAFAPAFLAATGIASAVVDDLMSTLARGDYVGFRRIVDDEDSVDLPSGEALLAMLSKLNPLSGASLSELVDIEWRNPSLGTQVENYWKGLVQFAEELKRMNLTHRLTFDLTLTRDISYYSGIVFEVFANGVGAPVALGGRYDGLLASFGAPAPAVGFTYEVERMMAALSEVEWTSEHQASSVDSQPVSPVRGSEHQAPITDSQPEVDKEC
ncbi:ATP phosphoribosyltransferase regulatory subunit [Alicyclobacillus mengziensis]|uniref:ATP phosphoribosyltransferase regulatory subunit n=2 Tax=Alicyclobacillus mengziensis TaxID=2931921 RepID=A0A9X7W3X3_9BACL|nr:ATP phosphoribosyltransferase regulatory subunit [Alicyclobacillus mengziensis]